MDIKLITDLPVIVEDECIYALDPITQSNVFSANVIRGRMYGHRTTVGQSQDVARRMALCWNFCAGLESDAIESAPGPAVALLASAIQEAQSLTEQRDRLAEALVHYRRALREDTDPAALEQAFQQADNKAGLTVLELGRQPVH